MVNSSMALFIGSIFGILPTLGLMLLLSHPYEKHFEDKDVFLAYIIGFALGVLLAVGHIFLVTGSIGTSSPIGALLTGALFALLTSLMIGSVINRKRYFGLPKARIGGLGVGLGIATALISFKIFIDVNAFFEDEAANYNFYMKLALYLVSTIAICAAGGMCMGDEVAKSRFKIGLLKTLGLNMFFYPLLFFHYIFFDFQQEYIVLAVLTPIALGAFMFQYIRNFRDPMNNETTPGKKLGTKKKGSGKKKGSRKGNRRRRR